VPPDISDGLIKFGPSISVCPNRRAIVLLCAAPALSTDAFSIDFQSIVAPLQHTGEMHLPEELMSRALFLIYCALDFACVSFALGVVTPLGATTMVQIGKR
jgi:hypothetical protein